MLFTLLGALVGIIAGSVRQASVVKYGAIGAVVGFVVFGIVAVRADKPKVPCWTESSGSQIFRAMPYFCHKKVEPARR